MVFGLDYGYCLYKQFIVVDNSTNSMPLKTK